MNVTDTLHFTDSLRTPVSSTSYISGSYLYVGSTAGFAAGQEVLIIQMTGAGAGTWETIYIGGTGLNTLVFSGPLRNAYYADAHNATHVIKVPHWTDVTIGSGGILMCHPWNGQTGGIIFFRASGMVTVSPGGLIEASGLGFPGGTGGSQGGSGGQADAEEAETKDAVARTARTGPAVRQVRQGRQEEMEGRALYAWITTQYGKHQPCARLRFRPVLYFRYHRLGYLGYRGVRSTLDHA